MTIGGYSPISIQSMTNLPIEDVNGTTDQIKRLSEQGADIVRIAVRDKDGIRHLKSIRDAVDIPLSADIHFNYKIAIMAIESGIDKIRINPGNIGNARRVKEVVKAAKDYSVPIRIGVNSGSIDRKKYRELTPENLVESAIEHIRILEENDFSDIIVSIKSSDILLTIESNMLFSSLRDYPLHIGLTEAGYGISSAVQSSVAIGHLLINGIGDTIRISMTGDPIDEVVIARKILESLGERFLAVRMISCPTCGRTNPKIDLFDIAKSVESEVNTKFASVLKKINRTIVVAIMGCEVNGPGEASHADIGVAGGIRGNFLIFSKGEKIGKIRKNRVVKPLLSEIEKIIKSWEGNS